MWRKGVQGKGELPAIDKQYPIILIIICIILLLMNTYHLVILINIYSLSYAIYYHV
jgi:hypothetical protein